MQASELAELSGVVAANGACLLAAGERLSESGLHQYWSTSKRRFLCWMQTLRDNSTPWSEGLPSRATRSVPWLAVAEEVLASESLTRVWTALVCQFDRRHPRNGGAAIVWSTFRCHEAARQSALQAIWAAADSDRSEAEALDRLRRRAEHWTDLLLAHLVPQGAAEAAAVAFDVPRLRSFACDLKELRQTRHAAQAWRLFQASLKPALRTRRRQTAPQAVLNRQIASGILTCFPSDLFDSTGSLQSLWQERLQHTTADALALVQDLLAAER